MVAGAHSHGHGHGGMAMASNVTVHYDPAYFTHPEHPGLLNAHIFLMTAAWVFILPVGVMLGLSRSRFFLPTQFVFLVVNAAGLLTGTIYNGNTPDLYENNVHHKFGWFLTCVVSAHVLLSFFPAYAPKKDNALVTLEPIYQRVADSPHMDPYRYSHDSGQGTEPPSPRSSSLGSHSRSSSNFSDRCVHNGGAELEEVENEKHGLLGNNLLDRFLISKLATTTSSKLGQSASLVCEIMNRVLLILGFVALTTGFVTYFGYFKGHGIFSGLAHFIKGGIFFWYGLLVLGRCMGSFADLGWSWNLKPDATIVGSRKAAAASAEFWESFLIFFYGSTNVFLEHLGNWGKGWSASDLEHISITVMFFGGGLCGMLVESKRIRELLNFGMSSLSTTQPYGIPAEGWRPPRTYGFSLNPLPGTIIMLLGLMMSSHHQESMVSTMLHKQWGTLFVVASLARATTYILLYVSPPTSYLPSRPPSEFVAAFCFIAGGLLFMGSAADIVTCMERFDLNAMFLFTVMMGLTAFLMAWEIVVLAIKGWSVRSQQSQL